MEAGARMNNYLMRLVLGGRSAGATPSMQPFVRSTSPIAEYDQRLGTMDFEGFDLGDASPVGADAEAGLGQDEVLQPPTPPSIPAAADVGVTTVQRKIASPPAGPLSPSAPTAWGEAAAEDAHMPGHLQPSVPRAIRSVAPVPSVTRHVTMHTERFTMSSSDVGVPDLAEAHDVLLPPAGAPRTDQYIPPPQAPEAPGAPAVSPEQSVVADVAWSVSSTGGMHPDMPSPGDAQTGSTSRQFGPGAVRTRSVRQTRQVDSLRPTPPRRTLAEPTGAAPEEATTPAARVDEGPRVIIGRINVEVVPPPAAPQGTTPPPGPLTAASVSVIGPLSGGIRPNLRLSLRHR